MSSPPKFKTKMEIFNEYFVQLGAVGLMLFGLIWLNFKFIKHFLEQTKESISENKALEAEFRGHLILQAKEHHIVIKNNTEAFTRLIDFFEGSFGDYLQKRTEAQREQSQELRRLIDKLNSD